MSSSARVPTIGVSRNKASYKARKGKEETNEKFTVLAAANRRLCAWLLHTMPARHQGRTQDRPRAQQRAGAIDHSKELEPMARTVGEAKQLELWPDGPVVNIKDLKAEHKRMREEGLIYDIETAHGTLTLIRNPLLEREPF